MELPAKKYMYPLIILIIIGVFFLLQRSEVEYISRSEFLMDTIVTIKIPESNRSEEIFDSVFQEMKDWDKKLNRMDSESIINNINESNGPIAVEEEVFELINSGLKYGQITDGAFDITIAPLIDLWGFGNDEHQVPAKEEIEKVLPQVNYREIEMDNEQRTVSIPDDMALDLGGIAKGFIIDQACQLLQEKGIESAFIDAGGDIRVIGSKNSGNSWQIGIRKPRARNEIFDDYILGLEGGSIATSGDYERFFIEDGIRYSHLIDPRTGYQKREFLSVSIYAPTALKADVISTAVFIMDWQAAKEFIEERNEIEGFLIGKTDRWSSSGFDKLIVIK